MWLSTIHNVGTAFLVGLLLFGCFSRLTRGVYPFTRSFHAYQLDRNSDEQLMNVIAGTDLVLALLLIPRSTRWFSALLISLAMGIGAYVRVAKEHKDATVDLLLLASAVTVLTSALQLRRSTWPFLHKTHTHHKNH